MKKEEAIELIKSSNDNKIVFAVTDIDGVLRGKTISKDKFKKGLDEQLGFCSVVFGWDMNDAVYDNTEVTGWHTGYPDAMATLDLTTLRRIPWNGDIPFFLADFSDADDMKKVCPRTLLKRVRQRALNVGYSPQFSNEFEWFNFRETPRSFSDKNHSNPTPLTPGMFGYSVLRSSQNRSYFITIYDQLHAFNVPIEAIHTETGDGVYEACIEYTDILEAADRASLFKTGVKEIAYQFEILVTFMAKWSVDFPGCSGHIHQSLWDEDQQENLFFNADAEHQISDLLQHYVAGQLHCLPHILPMYAPTINSYKRFVDGSWASTSVSWGVENRTTALRVINHKKNGMRLETRVPGADANPYLSMAASLASGLYGIENKLELKIPKTSGNEYDNNQSQHLPTTLQEATGAMKSSDLAKELFGETFTEHFIKTREWECRQYSKAVTDWELKRYFEII